MSKTYTDAIDFVLDHEGKVCENVPGDPGGKTKWGITQADYSQYRREHGLPVHDVFTATEAEIDQIYKAHYWNPCHCDEIPYSLALTLFDTAVNCGLGRAATWLQGVLGVTIDGVIGPQTMAAAKAYIGKHGAEQLAAGVIARRVEFYNRIGAPGRTLNKFLKGWLNRVEDLRAAIKED